MMQNQQCLFCGHSVDMIHVHGHYQCPVCKTNALPCCDGDNCDTNQLLKNSSNPKVNSVSEIKESITPSHGITGRFQ